MNTIVTILGLLKSYGPILVGALLAGLAAPVASGWREPLWLVGLVAALSFLSGVASLSHPAVAQAAADLKLARSMHTLTNDVEITGKPATTEFKKGN